MKKITKKEPTGITVKQTVRFGKPCIKGTRIAVTDILNLLKEGYNLQEIPNQYEGITVNKAKMAINYAANVLGKEEVLELN
ncbi:MAG: DUF433 domain-containing protein [Patescibacteria group bacterium]